MWVRVVLLLTYIRLMLHLHPKLNNKGKTYVYLLESPILWHARLGHVNYKSLKNLSNLGYISKLNLKKIRKCEICVEAKFAKIHFTQLIEIHDL